MTLIVISPVGIPAIAWSIALLWPGDPEATPIATQVFLFCTWGPLFLVGPFLYILWLFMGFGLIGTLIWTIASEALRRIVSRI